ncbi:MAG: class I SAM-dependent methyltransferase [Cyanobacteria bacterium SZAS LIN-3]|nr:class I SAM-dependent methyltransferase [Cyanobacteria bacterium SZAS LIN-3]
MYKNTSLLPKTNSPLGSDSSKGSPFFRNLVLKGLAAMPAGKLTMVLPGGEERIFGRDENPRVVARVVINDEAFFKRCVLYGHIGFAEAYMDGLWDSDDLASVIALFLLNVTDCPVMEGSGNHSPVFNLLGFVNQIQHILRKNTEKNSKKNIADHYDLSNEMFQLFLDETMTYSSASFSRSEMTLKDAQLEKYEKLCRKLKLTASDQVLEIGCGWGGFAIYAATNYGCKVTGVTISQQQYDFAASRIKALGLSDQIELVLKDYRQLTGLYDKIVSIEMIEAVGHEYIPVFFEKCDSLLKRDGLLAIQMITCPDSRYDLLRHNTDFIQKHIFPGSLLISMRRVSESLSHGSELFLHECEDMGNSYAQTLEMWRQNFETQLKNVMQLGFDQTFIRKWRYYFGYCSAAFAMRNISVVQVVYTRPNNLHLAAEPWLKRFSKDK